MQNITIAIVADDVAVRQQMRAALNTGGFAILEYDTRMVANLGGVKGAFIVVLGADRAQELEMLHRWQASEPNVPVIIQGPEALAESALARGAYSFVPSHSASTRLACEVGHAVEKRELTDKVNQLRDELTTRDHGEGNVVVPLRELERRAIGRALQATKGSVTKAAKLLGIGRATLYRRLASPELANLRPRRSYDSHAHAPAISAPSLQA